MPQLPSPAALLSSSQRKAATHRSIHLPSQLGSDVGNAFTTDTQADEKAHMEVIVNGVADRVLQEGPPEQGNGNHHVQQEQTHGEFCLHQLRLEYISHFPFSQRSFQKTGKEANEQASPACWGLCDFAPSSKSQLPKGET